MEDSTQNKILQYIFEYDKNNVFEEMFLSRDTAKYIFLDITPVELDNIISQLLNLNIICELGIHARLDFTPCGYEKYLSSLDQ
jgi:hypothetical protein